MTITAQTCYRHDCWPGAHQEDIISETCKLSCCFSCSFCNRASTKERSKSQIDRCKFQKLSIKICQKCFFCHSLVQCSLSSAISRVCTHSGASCRKTNSPTRLCCRYQAKHSKRTEEIRLLSEAATYIFPHRNWLEKQFILYIQLTVIHVRFRVFSRDFRALLSIFKLVFCFLCHRRNSRNNY